MIDSDRDYAFKGNPLCQQMCNLDVNPFWLNGLPDDFSSESVHFNFGGSYFSFLLDVMFAVSIFSESEWLLMIFCCCFESLHPSHQFFSQVRPGFHGLIQY